MSVQCAGAGQREKRMSYEDGMAALNLEMPARVPRTEYSIESHWEVLKAVTGVDVGVDNDGETKRRAQRAFFRAWDFDIFWSTLIGCGELEAKRTRMGHAEYAAGGADYDDRIEQAFTDPEEALRLDPWEVYGEKDKPELKLRFEEHYRRQVELDRGGVSMTGIYITCISGLIGIFGWDMLLLALGTDPERFGDLTNRYASWIQQYFDALGEADVPVVMVHDDIAWTSGAIFNPDWYRTYVFPNYTKYLAPLIDSGKKILFTSDGNYTEFIDDIAACGVNGFVLEPTTDMKYIAEKYGRTHVFIGNADTRILLRSPEAGTREEIRQKIRVEVERCMRIGKPCPGFFMAVGNHIPANTPVENCLYYNTVYEEMSRR